MRHLFESEIDPIAAYILAATSPVYVEDAPSKSPQNFVDSVFARKTSHNKAKEHAKKTSARTGAPEFKSDQLRPTLIFGTGRLLKRSYSEKDDVLIDWGEGIGTTLTSDTIRTTTGERAPKGLGHRSFQSLDHSFSDLLLKNGVETEKNLIEKIGIDKTIKNMKSIIDDHQDAIPKKIGILVNKTLESEGSTKENALKAMSAIFDISRQENLKAGKKSEPSIITDRYGKTVVIDRGSDDHERHATNVAVKTGASVGAIPFSAIHDPAFSVTVDDIWKKRFGSSFNYEPKRMGWSKKVGIDKVVDYSDIPDNMLYAFAKSLDLAIDKAHNLDLKDVMPRKDSSYLYHALRADGLDDMISFHKVFKTNNSIGERDLKILIDLALKKDDLGWYAYSDSESDNAIRNIIEDNDKVKLLGVSGLTKKIRANKTMFDAMKTVSALAYHNNDKALGAKYNISNPFEDINKEGWREKRLNFVNGLRSFLNEGIGAQTGSRSIFEQIIQNHKATRFHQGGRTPRYGHVKVNPSALAPHKEILELHSPEIADDLRRRIATDDGYRIPEKYYEEFLRDWEIVENKRKDDLVYHAPNDQDGGSDLPEEESGPDDLREDLRPVPKGYGRSYLPEIETDIPSYPIKEGLDFDEAWEERKNILVEERAHRIQKGERVKQFPVKKSLPDEVIESNEELLLQAAHIDNVIRNTEKAIRAINVYAEQANESTAKSRIPEFAHRYLNQIVRNSGYESVDDAIEFFNEKVISFKNTPVNSIEVSEERKMRKEMSDIAGHAASLHILAERAGLADEASRLGVIAIRADEFAKPIYSKDDDFPITRERRSEIALKNRYLQMHANNKEELYDFGRGNQPTSTPKVVRVKRRSRNAHNSR